MSKTRKEWRDRQILEALEALEPMTREEWREFGSATLHGPPPNKTLMRIYATVDKAMIALAKRQIQIDQVRELLSGPCGRPKGNYEYIQAEVERVLEGLGGKIEDDA